MTTNPTSRFTSNRSVRRTVRMPPELETQVESLVDAGLFQSTSEAIRASVLLSCLLFENVATEPVDIDPEALRTRRQHLGVTQAALADHAGVTQATVSRIENGTRTPAPGTMQQLQSALDDLV